jgi:predicted nuclease of predicted toxin-antitoxin system
MHKAWEEGRILLTHDLDFGELLAASRRNLPSVVIFRLRDMRPDNVKFHIEKILERHSNALQKGAICSVSERNIRVRALPI